MKDVEVDNFTGSAVQTAPENPALFQFFDVEFSYQLDGMQYKALQNINLQVNSGDYVAIIGASGSGKTTLMNLFGLLSLPTSGGIFFAGRNLEGLDEEQLASVRNTEIGFVFQHFALLPRLTVLDNILLPCRFSDDFAVSDLKQKAFQLLSDFGLQGLENRFPAELSGGQKQRVAICRAMLMNPKIILADEPTGALDSKTSAEVLAIFDRLNSLGYTIILITHDMQVAERARRRITLKDGQIQHDVKHNPTLNQYPNLQRYPDVWQTPQLIKLDGKNLKSHHQFFRMSSFWIKTIQSAIANLWANKLRSGLTGLGLLIGVCSIVIIAGLGEVAQNVFNNMFYNAGTSKIYIYFDRDKSLGMGVRYWRGLSLRHDFPVFADKFKKYGRFRPLIRTSNCLVQSQGQPARAGLVGMYDVDEFAELDTKLLKGRLPTEIESISGANVVVLGKDSVDLLFAKTDPARAKVDFPIGELLSVSSCNVLLNLRVIGVLDEIDTSFGRREANDVLYLPMEAIVQATNETHVNFISILPNRDVDPRWLANNVTNYLSAREGEKFFFSAAIPAEIIEKIRGFLLIIQALTGFIGGLCIIVGGIGIMNIMIVTVTERIREIGILKSQGAKPFHIRNQFVVESVTLCIAAGVCGVILGLFVTNAISYLAFIIQGKNASFVPIFSPLGVIIGVLVSFICGVGFGLLPALRASRMQPAECMREE